MKDHRTTEEAIQRLQEIHQVSEELAETFLGAWVELFQFQALERLEKDPTWLDEVVAGRGEFVVSRDFLVGTEARDRIAQLYGLEHAEAIKLLETIDKKILPKSGSVDFEPVGLITRVVNNYRIHLRSDFLEPTPDTEDELVSSVSVP
jgi:hypothetical protein